MAPTPAAFAQNPLGQIAGTVRDSSGTAVPGAQLLAESPSLGLRRVALSNDQGFYFFANLIPGDYDLEAAHAGFAVTVHRQLRVSVNRVTRLDFVLSISPRSESVQVSSSAAMLDGTTASIGQLIDSRALAELPANGRNFLQFAKLAVGVMEPKPRDTAALGGSFVANGVRAQLNNFLLDGVDNNSKILDLQNRSPVVIQPPLDAIEEMRIETSNYSAEYGHSAGAVVNAVIKSGTNTAHGSAFEFLRNGALDAKNYFSAPGSAKRPLRQNQLGGTFGGPVHRNRAFAFGSWETTRSSRGLTYLQTVPTAAQRAGDLSDLRPLYDPSSTASSANGAYDRAPFPRNQIPPGLFDGAARALLQAIPLPTAAGQIINNYVATPIDTSGTDHLDVRNDLHLSRNLSAFARYSLLRGEQTTPGPFPPPIVGSTTYQIAPHTTLGSGAALGLTHSWSHAVHEFRAGYNRIHDLLQPFVREQINNQFRLGGIPEQAGITGLPQIMISGYPNLGEAAFLPNDKLSEVVTLLDHVSWTRGRHLAKAGASYRWVRSWFDVSAYARGQYNFTGAFTQDPQRPGGSGASLADFLLGLPAAATLSNRIQGDLRYRYWGGYLQDDWRATSRLTLNLGLRYELWSQPAERNDRAANFLVSPAKLVYAARTVPAEAPGSIVAAIPPGINRRSLMRTDRNNLAPRAGIAYQANPKTVIRAGAGLFFADHPAIGANARPVANPPFYRNLLYPTDGITPGIHLSSGFPQNPFAKQLDLTELGLNAFAADMDQSPVYHWSLSIQREFRGAAVEWSYTGTRGIGLPLTYNVNQPYAGPGSVASRRPYQGFGDINLTSGMDSSSYHGLGVRLEHPYSAGFFLLVSYTYSKTIDVGGEALLVDLSLRDGRNVRAERSLSAGDQRHRWSTGAAYDFPWGRDRRAARGIWSRIFLNGWRANAILTVRTGQPFTPALSVSTANTGVARPDRLSDGNLPAAERSVGRWFDKEAFAVPLPYQYGNAGRNILTSPGAVNLDFSLFKILPVRVLGEQGQLQLRMEAFNSLNHPQFGMPNPQVDIPQGGTVTTLSNSMRELQAAVRIQF